MNKDVRRARPVFWLVCVWGWWLQVGLAVAAEGHGEYFPLAVGNRWVYESSEGSETVPALESWEILRKEGRGFVVRIKQPFITFDGVEERLDPVSGGVSRRVRSATSSLTQVLLKPPFTVGAQWQEADGGRSAVTAVGETVTTPAGTFADCVEITRRRKGSQTIVVSTYAPGVGMVQREETFSVIYGGVGGDLSIPAKGRVVLRLKEWKIRKMAPTPP